MEYLPAIFALEWREVALLASILLTVVHAAEEAFGDGGPLWDYFGGIAGVKVPCWLGALVALVALPAALIACAHLGYVNGSTVALSVLVGAKLGDAFASHWLPWVMGARPNPGVWSSFPAAIESVLAMTMGVDPFIAAGSGVVFIFVIPVLSLFGSDE